MSNDDLTASTIYEQKIVSGWFIVSTSPGQFSDPSELSSQSLSWLKGVVPGTVAQACYEAGQWDLSQTFDFDACDWWYRTTFTHQLAGNADQIILNISGLATLADVWLNGQLILRSENMYLSYELDVGALLHEENELTICFRSLAAALRQRRPRPRWKTRLVRNQQLRWFRTTLLGRMAGLSPTVAPIGPWRPISVLQRQVDTLIEPCLDAVLIGNDGALNFSAYLHSDSICSIEGMLSIAGLTVPLVVEHNGDRVRLSCSVRILGVKPWWPKTHGEPYLYACTSTITINGRKVTHNLGHIGFRSIQLDQESGQYALKINGKAVFCRGACWTANDIVSLSSPAIELENTLRLLRDAGGNMVKVGGTMLYESSDFYRLCDELGILVWQEFMFANMDYPFDDERFHTTVVDEAKQQLNRWRQHACIAVYCGNSDIELEASMFGMPRDNWRSKFFEEALPLLIETIHPGVPYIPSSPSGGDMPFHVGAGITHYYAIGAFMQPLSRVRSDSIRFASECCGFAHIPEPEVIDELFGGELPMIHDPRWKQRVARHSGFGYDFDDVRDYYLEQLFSVDSRDLRIRDTARYLTLSRIVTGEILSRIYSEWRRPSSTCQGALVWFLKDFWLGAGQGILDSRSYPKASYYFLRRVWLPQAIFLTDEGFDGVSVHLVNENQTPLIGKVELILIRGGKAVVAKGSQQCELYPGEAISIGSDVLLSGFYDAAYVYRFGPPNHDVVIGTLLDSSGHVQAQAFYFPHACEPTRTTDLKVLALASPHPEGYLLTVETDQFLHSVRIDMTGYMPEDNYFHLAPGYARSVLCRRTSQGSVTMKGSIEALNMPESVRIQLSSE